MRVGWGGSGAPIRSKRLRGNSRDTFRSRVAAGMAAPASTTDFMRIAASTATAGIANKVAFASGEARAVTNPAFQL